MEEENGLKTKKKDVGGDDSYSLNEEQFDRESENPELDRQLRREEKFETEEVVEQIKEDWSAKPFWI